jgi:hypothetical protein
MQQTVSAIVKETLAGRKHICPQNTYETTQLYAAGALKVACVGLLCVGFNHEVYESILDFSVKFSESKWKSLAIVSAKVASEAAQDSPTMSASENGNTPPPATVAGLKPTMKTPIMQKQFPRTPSFLSNPGSMTSSPSPRRVQIEMHNYTRASPPLGLGFGPSMWSMASNGRANSLPVSLANRDFESMVLPKECLKGEAYQEETRPIDKET